jgi:hypothetical protein
MVVFPISLSSKAAGNAFESDHGAFLKAFSPMQKLEIKSQFTQQSSIAPSVSNRGKH